MAFNISQFSSNLNRLGTSKTSLFEVIITPPEALGTEYISTRDLTFRASAVQLPQLDIATRTFYPQSIGRGQRRATGLTEFNIIPIKFVVDANHNVVRFFHNWIRNIVNYDINGGASGTNSVGMASYEVGYKSDYSSQITINVYSDNIERITYRYELINAFPVNTPSLILDWNNTDQLMELDIGFTYDGLQVSGVESNVAPLYDPFFLQPGSLNSITTETLPTSITGSETETITIP